jgi:cytochrome c556
MSRIISVRSLLFTGLSLLLLATSAIPQTPRMQPKLEAVAETRLLMEGLNQANFRGLERLLRQKPADAETWTFARGQALLIAETGNLLMLRPPRNAGETAWMQHATELRESSSRLARTLAEADYPRSRAALAGVADSCNRCHQTFRVKVRVKPFAEGQ